MSKITPEKFDVCHNFMSGCAQYILPLNERKFVDLTHLVSADEYTIFVSYDKKNFRGRIKQFIREIIKEAQKSDLWKFHSPLVEETINYPYELFHDCFLITFTTV